MSNVVNAGKNSLEGAVTKRKKIRNEAKLKMYVQKEQTHVKV